MCSITNNCIAPFNFKGFVMWAVSPQIGNRFALTAAHCLYDDDKKEELPATSFSVMLGLHDRNKAKELSRWLNPHDLVNICIGLYIRKQIRITEVIPHENFTSSFIDIALLRLGEEPFLILVTHFISKTCRRPRWSVSLQPCLSSWWWKLLRPGWTHIRWAKKNI